MRRYKIVIVENDEDEQFFMNEGFMTADVFDVLAILNNGDALFRWLTQNGNNLPDVILSDLNMPGKNGYDIITEIKSTPAYQHIPVIITSTSSTKSFIDKCLAYGAAAYIIKPETFVEYVPFAKNVFETIQQQSLVK
jgi:CheY-like chemotaxis protein